MERESRKRDEELREIRRKKESIQQELTEIGKLFEELGRDLQEKPEKVNLSSLKNLIPGTQLTWEKLKTLIQNDKLENLLTDYKRVFNEWSTAKENIG